MSLVFIFHFASSVQLDLGSIRSQSRSGRVGSKFHLTNYVLVGILILVAALYPSNGPVTSFRRWSRTSSVTDTGKG